MDFPNYTPNERNFTPGDWPIARYNSQNGTEIRILRGSNRYGAKLSLSFTNITDSIAAEFLAHYRSVIGTYQPWYFTASPRVFSGWDTATTEFEASPWGLAWRYDRPPEVTQVKKGRSSVRIELTAILAT